VNANPSGGGGSANINGDTHPVSPTAYDDEFETSSLDPKWTARNSPTISFSHGSLVLTTTSSGGDNLQGVTQAIPTAPYRIGCKLAFDVRGVNYKNAGLFLLDSSSGKLGTVSLAYNGGFQLQVNKYSSYTSFASTSFFEGLNQYATAPPYYGISDDGTNRFHEISFDGFEWFSIYSEADNAFMTPTEIGICMDINSSGNSGIASFDWFRRL
jgi:hypothetical protein